MNRSLLRFLFSLVISGILVYFVLRRFDFDLVWSTIGKSNANGLVAGFLLIVLAYLLRGIRWRIWESELRFWDSFKLILIGFMGNNLLPARLGEILRAVCTSRKKQNNYGSTAAVASITIERILDGFILSCFGLVGLALVHVTKPYFYSLMAVSLAFGGLTFCLLGSIYYDKWLRNLLSQIHQIFPGHLTRFGQEKVSFFLDGLLLIKGFKKLSAATLATAIIWGTEYFAYYQIGNSVISGFSPQVCFLFLVVVNFASLFPFSVGGIGAIESVATFFLINAGIPAHEALAMVSIQHAFQFAFTTGLGAIFYFSDGYYLLKSPAQKNSKENAPEKNSKSNHLQDAYAHINELASNLKLEKKDSKTLELSIVIPGYNEIRRLPKTLLQTITWCAQSGLSYEIIYVDDGSTDDTVSIANLFGNLAPTVRTITCPHYGKGSAVRMGMLNAMGSFVLFMDADGATPLEEIPKLLTRLKSGTEIAIGSRVPQLPGETEVVTSLHRRIMGRVFSAIVNLFAVPGFADTQCGFKMFRKEVVKDLFTRQKLHGFAFDVELLFIADKLGLSVEEIPVNWVNQDGSKVNVVSDSLKMLADILRIKWMHRGAKWMKSPKGNHMSSLQSAQGNS